MADPGRASGCNFLRKTPRNFRRRASDDDAAPSLELHFSSTRPSTPDAAASNPDPTLFPDAILFRYASSTEIQVDHDSRATVTLETETDFSKDPRAIRERILKLAEEALKANPKLGAASSCSKIYKGINSYTDYKAGFRREQTVAGEKASGAHGPLRASVHIRMSTKFDYQSDICKDYKETGYCGFGDACKFMHDRGDYKSGWQMDQEWEEKEKARKRKWNLAMKGKDDEEGGGREDDDGEDEVALPLACFICRKPFRDPVTTKCEHFFCELCAFKHHKKSKKCFVCSKPTLGLFNTAHAIKKRTKQEKCPKLLFL